MIPFAGPGCVLLPWKVTVAVRALQVSSLISPSFRRRPCKRLCPETFDVKLLDPAADFFVRSESDGDGAVLDLWVLTQRVDHRHDLSDARLVVRTEQRCAVGSDDVVADQSPSRPGFFATVMT